MGPRDWGHALLAGMIGRRLESVARAHHRHRGVTDEHRGPLELAFDGGRVVNLSTAPNGESVWVREGRWRDPVADPDDPWSPEWVAEHGEWTRVDAGERAGYAEARGQPLSGLRWLGNEHGSIAGVELWFGGAVLTFVSWGDDEYVVTGDASTVPAEWGMRVLSPMSAESMSST